MQKNTTICPSSKEIALSGNYQCNNTYHRNSFFRKLTCISNDIATLPALRSTEKSPKRRLTAHRDMGVRANGKNSENHLFSCVKEFRQILGTPLNTGGSQYITVEINDRQYSIPATRVELPSKRKIYVGIFASRWVVSCGENYYIENIIIPKPLGLLPTAALLAAGATTAGGWELWDKARSWLTWFGKLADIGKFPMAAAQMPNAPTASPGDEFLYEETVEFSAVRDTQPLEPNITDTDDEVLAEADVETATVITTLSTTSAPPASTLRPVGQDLSGKPLPHPTSSFVFLIDDLELQLIVAPRNARKYLDELKTEFLQNADNHGHKLPQLLALDHFLGEYVIKIFHQGLYFKDDANPLNTIIFKKNTENFIDKCRHNPHASQATIAHITTYASSQTLLSNYILNIDKQLIRANENIDDAIFSELLETQRYKSFEETRKIIRQESNNADFTKDNHFKEIMSLLHIMEDAYNEYCNELIIDDTTPIDRVIYQNNKGIYNALIKHDGQELKNSLIKLRFFFIFEYTRSNGISVRSSNFLLPGELSNHWYLFSADEMELQHAKVENILVTELDNLLNQRSDSYPNIALLMRLIELSRLNEQMLHSSDRWQEKNIFPFTVTYNILKEVLTYNSREKEKVKSLKFWYRDYLNILEKAKISFVLLIYITDLQEKFNNNIEIYLTSSVFSGVGTNIQKVINAKIMAAKSLISGQQSDAYDDDRLLSEYEKMIAAGNLDVIIKAAAIWYLSYEHHRTDRMLSSVNVLYVIKKFITLNKYIHIELDMRNQLVYSSVFKLECRTYFTSLEDYYQQFIEYKLHDSYHEAINMTTMALGNATIGLVDLIYPPKEIYTFKIFSRNFVVNPASPLTSFSFPHNNIGFISLFKTHSNRFYALSTLNSLAFIINITHLQHSSLIKQLITHWGNSGINLDIRNRPHFGVNETDMMSLLSLAVNDNEANEPVINFLLRQPESDLEQKAIPPYSFSPVRNEDIASTISDYSIHFSENVHPLAINVPLMTSIDSLNQATLIEIANELKESLLKYTWPEYIGQLLPFFETLVRHWYDEEHEIKFHEIIFDLFDVVMTCFNIGNRLHKLANVSLNNLLEKAVRLKISRSRIIQFIAAELASIAPQLVSTGGKIALQELSSLINPGPISPSLLFNLVKQKSHKKIAESIALVNESIRKEITHKKNQRQAWKVDMEGKTFHQQGDIWIDGDNSKRKYIKNNNDFFRVHEDSNQLLRIVNDQAANDKNLAIPIVKGPTGDWIADRSDLFNYREFPRNLMQLSGKNILGLESIESEPLSPVEIESRHNYEKIEFHKKVLRFYLYKNDYVRNLIAGTANHEHFLYKLNKSLFFRKEIVDLLKTNPSSLGESMLVDALNTLNDRQDSIVRFRAITSWKDNGDVNPITYYALTVDIEDVKYILDLREMRAHLKLFDKRDVFTHNEWVMMYRHDVNIGYELIKYKDFEHREDAKYFPFRESMSASNYIKDGYLLTDPNWYQASLVKKYNHVYNSKYSFQRTVAKDFRSAMRSLRHSKTIHFDKQEYPIKILYRCGKINTETFDLLINIIKSAKIDSYNSGALLTHKVRLSSIEDLLKVNEGKLVGFYSLSNQLEHLLLSLGNGRFTGVQNNFFDNGLPERPSIIIAEQMGEFVNGILTLKQAEKRLIVLTGAAFGSMEDTPTLLDSLPQESMPKYFVDGRLLEHRRQAIPRQRVLLGKDCRIEAINDLGTRIRIKMHGAPFNINHMDAIEFSDIIRGLPHLENAVFNLQELTSIELFSCYGGYGNRYSTAQILADELGVDVKAFPHKVSDDIRTRRPEWFRVFHPKQKKRLSIIDTIHPHENITPKMAQKIHRTFHDLWGSLRDTINSLTAARQKRDHENIPPIYIDLLKLIILHEPESPVKIGGIELRYESLSLLRHILAEYDIDGIEEPEIIEQTFLDIILSIDELRYLSDGFNDPIPSGENR